MNSALCVVILAAGLGTRMKSDKAKVLHEICGLPMIQYVFRGAVEIAGPNIVVVVGHQADQVRRAVNSVGHAYFALQDQQLGTGHAVLCALPAIPPEIEHVVILCGDVPLIREKTIEKLVSEHIAQNRDVSLLTVKAADPKGYGRIISASDGRLTAIVEEADADDEQKQIKTINTGIYVVKRGFLESALPQLRADNAQKEIYLTDIIGIGYRENRTMGTVMAGDSDEAMGVNSQADLELVEDLMKLRLREKS